MPSFRPARGAGSSLEAGMMSAFALGQMLVRRSGYGAMQLAGPYAFGPPPDRASAIGVLQAAVVAGVDHIDTAQYCGPGVVNDLIREALHPYRDGLAIVSKVAVRRDDDGAVLPFDDPDQLCEGTENNLRSLRVGQLAAVNLRLSGDGRADARFDDQLAAMVAARDEGLIAGVGRRALTGTRSNAIQGDGKSGPQPAHSRPVHGRSGLRCSGRANHRDQVTPPHLPGGKPGGGPPPGRKFQQRIDMGERAWSAAQPTPTEGRSSVSTEQRENLEAILRQSAFPVDIDVNEQRRLLRELTSAQPLPADVTVTAAALGGVPTAEITIDGIEPRHVVLYFHGGVYVLGDAFQAADLASQVGRRTRAKVISVDYRLAPEHPYPAAVDDALAAYEALLHNGTAPSDIAFAGESAGGGLAIATLVNARDHGLPLPAAAFVMSPYADLTLAGTTMQTKREVDPLMSRENLQSRVTDYTSGQDAALGLISPIFADLSGLPPLIIQAGTHEVLLDEAAAALDRAGQFLSAHLAGAERVTA